MATTTSKKTPATTKATASASTKTTIKKVATKPAVTKTTVKGTLAPTAKKTVAKPAATKVTEKKTTTVKTAALETKPVVKSAVKAVPVKESKPSISPEHRYHMIATAAYFLAQKRGFAGGYEMQDWITAESQIDTQLKS